MIKLVSNTTQYSVLFLTEKLQIFSDLGDVVARKVPEGVWVRHRPSYSLEISSIFNDFSSNLSLVPVTGTFLAPVTGLRLIFYVITDCDTATGGSRA